MKIYVPVADKYIHLMPMFAKFFNKYWGDTQEVHCLTNGKAIDTPDNFKFVDIGAKWEEEPWANALIDYFNFIDDEYFIFTLDDHFLVRPIDFEGLKVMEQAVAEGEADKAMIHAHLNIYGHPWEFQGHKCIKLKQDAPYKTTIHPAIWSRKLFLKWLKPNQSIWQFELKNQKESQTDGSVVVSWPTKTGDGKCLEERGDSIFNVFNVYRNGKFQKHAIDEGIVIPEDMHIIESIM